MIGRVCKGSNVFSLPVLIARLALSLSLIHAHSTFGVAKLRWSANATGNSVRNCRKRIARDSSFAKTSAMALPMQAGQKPNPLHPFNSDLPPPAVKVRRVKIMQSRNNLGKILADRQSRGPGRRYRVGSCPSAAKHLSSIRFSEMTVDVRLAGICGTQATQKASPQGSNPVAICCANLCRVRTRLDLQRRCKSLTVFRRPGGSSGGPEPDPIPNSAVKPPSANGTSSQDAGE